MATTARDILTAALTELGVLASGEVATGQEGIDGLVSFNNLLDSWAAERLNIYTITRTTWTIVSGTSTYTVGAGGTVNIARPVFVDNIKFIDTAMTTPYEYTLGLLTDAAYEAIPSKTLTATYPSTAYYQQTLATSGFAQLFLWPVPTSATLTGVIYAPQACPELATLDTNILLLTGYRRMLVKNLALELAPQYERQADPALVAQAMEAKATVKRANFRLADLTIDQGALPQGTYHRWGYGFSIFQG